MKETSEDAAAGATRYVGDYGPDAGRGGLAWKLALAVLSAAIGFTAALAIRAVMFLVTVCERLLWETLPRWSASPARPLSSARSAGSASGCGPSATAGPRSRFPA